MSETVDSLILDLLEMVMATAAGMALLEGRRPGGATMRDGRLLIPRW